MAFDADFSQDDEFIKLLSHRSDIDLTVAALELARDAYPGLDFQATLNWVDARAAELAGPIAAAPSGRDALAKLSECLGEKLGIGGDAEAFDRADSSFLNRVIETTRGIPISLSVLYMAVAQRVGLELEGVSSPLHFVTRYESAEQTLFLDAFSGGNIMTLDECIEWLVSLTGLPPKQIQSGLKPVGPRPIIIRMLNNLKSLYVRQEKWPNASVVQQRLVALQPGSYLDRRDMALIVLKSGRPGKAVKLLEACLKNCPDDEQDILLQNLEDAKAQMVLWN